MAERACVLATFILLACVAMFRSSEARSQSMPVDGLIEQVAAIKQSLIPASHEKLRREVVLFGVDNQECKDWKQIEQPKFESDGWVVATSNDPGDGPWPHFVIEKSGKQYSYKGYLFFKQIDEATR
jgi:hypothetical protein